MLRFRDAPCRVRRRRACSRFAAVSSTSQSRSLVQGTTELVETQISGPDDDDVFYLFLQKQKSAQSYTPRVLPTIRGCLEGLALVV
jgi:hypothetical protein